MFRRKGIAAIAASAALALTLSACGGSDDQGSTTGGTASKTLTLGLITQASTFAAADMNFANESPYGQAVYDSLLRADPSGKIIPSLAKEWSYNEDKTVLTLTLRDDVVFTDDTKFTAEIAAQNVLRFRDGVSPNKSYLADVADAKATDATHLVITLKQSNPAILTYLSQNAGMQGSPKAFNAPDAKTNPVGSGPYVLDTKNTVVGSSYAFTRNAKYWDKATFPYDNLVLKFYADPTAMLNAAKGHQLNGVKLINNDSLDQVAAAGYSFVNWETDDWGMPLYDRAGKVNPALGKVEVRRAINMAFDRPALLQAFARGKGTVTQQSFGPNTPGFDPALDKKYPYDPAGAKALLAQAGYPNGFTLAMPTTTRLPSSTYTLVAQQLADIGIKVTYTEVGSQYVPDQLAQKFAAAVMPLQQDPPWQLINFKMAPTSTWNMFKYSDPKVDGLIKTIHDAKTDAEATPAYKELNAYIVDQAWFAPWYRLQNNYALDKDTVTVAQADNSHPYLWNYKPKS